MEPLSLDIMTTVEGITVSASGEIDMETVDHLKDTLTGSASTGRPCVSTCET